MSIWDRGIDFLAGKLDVAKKEPAFTLSIVVLGFVGGLTLMTWYDARTIGGLRDHIDTLRDEKEGGDMTAFAKVMKLQLGLARPGASGLRLSILDSGSMNAKILTQQIAAAVDIVGLYPAPVVDNPPGFGWHPGVLVGVLDPNKPTLQEENLCGVLRVAGFNPAFWKLPPDVYRQYHTSEAEIILTD